MPVCQYLRIESVHSHSGCENDIEMLSYWKIKNTSIGSVVMQILRIALTILQFSVYEVLHKTERENRNNIHMFYLLMSLQQQHES